MRYWSMLCAACLVAVLTTSAGAFPQFYAEFKKEYMDTSKDKKFADEMNKGDVKCLVCHQGKQKKARNPFGNAVGKFLTKKDMKNPEKISEGLKKALAMHVDPKDEKSETFLDRLKAGQWPGGKLQKMKTDPPKKDGDAKDAKKE